LASARVTGLNENISTYGVGRDYTSLNAWKTATAYDLVTAQVTEVLECYDDAIYDDQLQLSGATTSHGGSIELMSNQPSGTTVAIRLPLAPTASSNLEPTPCS
jgi:hypothetical protein